MLNNFFFIFIPPSAENPVKADVLDITRWQGIINSIGFFPQACPIALGEEFKIFEIFR